MDLTGRLSNHDLTTLLQRLTAREWKQGRRSHPHVGGVAPDGRRRFGSVRDAIVAVLAESGHEVRVRDIHQGVEKLLGETVARSSVKDYLRKGCRRRTPLFEHCGRRGYRLAKRSGLHRTGAVAELAESRSNGEHRPHAARTISFYEGVVGTASASEAQE